MNAPFIHKLFLKETIFMGLSKDFLTNVCELFIVSQVSDNVPLTELQKLQAVLLWSEYFSDRYVDATHNHSMACI